MKTAVLSVSSVAWLLLMSLALAAAPAWAQSEIREASELRFSGFFRHPIGPRGLEMADALRAADGRRVRLVGYMVAQEQPTPGRFMLTPRPVRMSEHADGEADDLPPATVAVLLDEHQRDRVIEHRPGLISIVGRLAVGREEDSGGRVSWVRLHLDSDGVADSAPRESAHTQDNAPTHPRSQGSFSLLSTHSQP